VACQHEHDKSDSEMQDGETLLHQTMKVQRLYAVKLGKLGHTFMFLF
jgi:hypothetical protein